MHPRRKVSFLVLNLRCNFCKPLLRVCELIPIMNKKDGYRQLNMRQFQQSAYRGTLFGYLTRVTPLCRCLHPFCGTRHLATSRESKVRFGLSLCVRPGTIAVNVTWMERGFNACQTHRSLYPSIFNRFPVIQPVSSKVRHFITFLHILDSLGTPLGQSR